MCFCCSQSNVDGVTQKRLLAIDHKRSMLMNLTPTTLELQKQLPLKQLVQLEKSAIDPRRLALVFSSTGARPLVCVCVCVTLYSPVWMCARRFGDVG